jgi:hypothetical protein
MRRAARAVRIVATAAIWLVATAPAAPADPAGPTDYRTEVIRVEPAVRGIEVRVVGGDSFVLVEADLGTTVEVVGYDGEPYLRFLPDGTVEENRNSPTTYVNLDRYGRADVPPHAAADAAPDWVVVAGDGSYAWHDHRTHWMNEARPPGREPGDVILEGVVPLLVDGVEVDVTFRSTWLTAPSPFAVLAGLAVGLAVVVAAALRSAGLRTLAWLLAGLSAAAAVLGAVAYLSVPSETGPSWTLWVPPATAVLLTLPAARGGLPDRIRRWTGPLALIAACELVAWGFLHRTWLWQAVLPTATPHWLERFVTSAVILAGIGLLMLIGRAPFAVESD